MATDRLTKINKLLSVEVAKVLKEEIEIRENVIVTITKVTVSRTLEHATVGISVLPEQRADEIFQKITKRIYSIQQQINKKVHMDPIPKLRFELDASEARITHLEELIGSIEADD